MYDALLAFTLLNLVDIITTKRAVLDLGAREANPIARWFIEKFGVAGMFLLKYAGMALSIAVGLATGQTEAGIWVSNAILSLVIINNSVVLYRLTSIKDRKDRREG